MSAIYVSSTADVFISHVGREISLPLVLVLMGLSIVGMLSGMLLQVRSFLYLGFTFLLVDLSIMVYHAAWDLGPHLGVLGIGNRRRRRHPHALCHLRKTPQRSRPASGKWKMKLMPLAWMTSSEIPKIKLVQVLELAFFRFGQRLLDHLAGGIGVQAPKFAQVL